MEYQQEHLPMLADDPGHQSRVSNLRQPSSTSHQKWLDRESLWIRFPPWIVSLSQKSPCGVEECCDLRRPLVEDHSGLHQSSEVGEPGWAQHQTRVICWWLTFGTWAMVVRWPPLDAADLEVKCVQWQYPHSSISLVVEHQQQHQFPSETPGCSGRLWWLWWNLTTSDRKLHASHHPGDGSRCILTSITLHQVYTPSERHVYDSLRKGCSYAVAIYATHGDVYACLRPIATFYLSAIVIYWMPHSPDICLALRFRHILQCSLRFRYIACCCSCFAIIVFYRSEIYSLIFTLSGTMPLVLHILR